MDEDEKRKQHDLAHNLAEEILDTIDEFLINHGRLNVTAASLLLGAEMAASVCRRLARDTGVTKDTVKLMMYAASRCGGEVYAKRYAENVEPVEPAAAVADDLPVDSPVIRKMTGGVVGQPIVINGVSNALPYIGGQLPCVGDVVLENANLGEMVVVGFDRDGDPMLSKVDDDDDYSSGYFARSLTLLRRCGMPDEDSSLPIPSGKDN